ncbi:MAG: response regulator transcription factor, partial [Opitutaceae bacterium]
MKILAADDNPVARTVLRAFLENSGYIPIIVEDGVAAFKEMQEADAPHIAILDWMMPGISGPELCAKLRATIRPIRPYVILLTAKAEKTDIASGLDAGADELITKPFNQVEMLARLRVAQRMIRFQIELQDRIDQLEAMVQRHRLLGEIIAQRSDGTATVLDAQEPISQPSASDETRTEDPSPKTSALELSGIGEAFKQALNDLGWDDCPLSFGKAEGSYRGASMTAWSGIYIPKLELWIDLLLEVEPSLALRLFEKPMRRHPVDDRELLNFLAEAVTLITAKCKSILQAKDCTSVSPFLPRGSRLGKLSRPIPVPSQRETCSVEILGEKLNLTIARTPSPTKQKTTGQLNPSDILSEAFQPSEDLCLPLLNQGTVLTERFIERLVVYSQNEMKNLKLPVTEPSPVTLYF